METITQTERQREEKVGQKLDALFKRLEATIREEFPDASYIITLRDPVSEWIARAMDIPDASDRATPVALLGEAMHIVQETLGISPEELGTFVPAVLDMLIKGLKENQKSDAEYHADAAV